MWWTGVRARREAAMLCDGRVVRRSSWCAVEREVPRCCCCEAEVGGRKAKVL